MKSPFLSVRIARQFLAIYSFLSGLWRRTWIRAIVVLGVAALAVAAFWMIHRLGETLLVPPRRVPGDWQNAVINDPQHHGVVFDRFSTIAEDGVGIQALLVRPAAVPGESMRYREMRRRLGREALFPAGDAAAGIPVGKSFAAVRATVFLLHGRSGIKEDGVTIAERFAAAGLATVLFDSRGHGESDAYLASYGMREVGDLQNLINALQAQYPEHGNAGSVPLFAFGNSMGAAVALQALPKESRLQAAIVVSPFADLAEVTGEMLRGRLPAFVRPGAGALQLAVSGYARARAGFSLADICPESSASSIAVPTMVVHGENDTMIPLVHGQRIFAAITGNRKIWRPVDGAQHGNVLMQGGDDLYEEMVRFYLDVLAGVSIEPDIERPAHRERMLSTR